MQEQQPCACLKANKHVVFLPPSSTAGAFIQTPSMRDPGSFPVDLDAIRHLTIGRCELAVRLRNALMGEQYLDCARQSNRKRRQALLAQKAELIA